MSAAPPPRHGQAGVDHGPRSPARPPVAGRTLAAENGKRGNAQVVGQVAHSRVASDHPARLAGIPCQGVQGLQPGHFKAIPDDGPPLGLFLGRKDKSHFIPRRIESPGHADELAERPVLGLILAGGVDYHPAADPSRREAVRDTDSVLWRHPGQGQGSTTEGDEVFHHTAVPIKEMLFEHMTWDGNALDQAVRRGVGLGQDQVEPAQHFTKVFRDRWFFDGEVGEPGLESPGRGAEEGRFVVITVQVVGQGEID